MTARQEVICLKGRHPLSSAPRIDVLANVYVLRGSLLTIENLLTIETTRTPKDRLKRSSKPIGERSKVDKKTLAPFGRRMGAV